VPSAEEEERRERELGAFATQLLDRIGFGTAAAGLLIMTSVAQRGEADGRYAWAAGLAGVATILGLATWVARLLLVNRPSDAVSERARTWVASS
jgi:hypothetical protein